MTEHDLLAKLHTVLAEQLLERVTDPEAKSADLNVARQFLKDNGIEALATKAQAVGLSASGQGPISSDEECEASIIKNKSRMARTKLQNFVLYKFWYRKPKKVPTLPNTCNRNN
jgi:hypothetical protein